MNQDELIKVLKAAAPMNWPTIHGAVYHHREECMNEFARRVLAALEDPATTRKLLKQQLREWAKELTEHGPGP